MIGLLGAVIPSVLELVDDLYETDAEKAAAKAKIMAAAADGRLKDLEVRLSAILAEAKSADPWTSRARPSFLYLFYAVILSCFVGGILTIPYPEQVGMASMGIRALLQAIPEQMWWLFGAGYLGYSTARSFDKRNMMKGKD